MLCHQQQQQQDKKQQHRRNSNKQKIVFLSPSLFASWRIPLTGKIRNVRALLASLGNTIRMYYQPTSSNNKEMICECFCFHQNESPTNQWQWTEKNGNAKGVFHPIRMYNHPSMTNNSKELIIDSNCLVVKFLTVGIYQNHYDFDGTYV